MTILYYQHSTGYTPIKDLLEKCKWHSLVFGDLIVTSSQDGVDLFYVNKDVDYSDIVKDYTHVFHCDDNTIPMDKSGVMFSFDHSHKRRGYRKSLLWMAAAADTDIIEDIFNDAIRILDYKEERLDANNTMRFMRFCQELKNPEIGKSVVSIAESSKSKIKIVEKVVEKIVYVPVEKVVEKIVEVPVEKIKEVKVEIPIEKIVEKRIEVPVDSKEQQKESQLRDITDSILMEYVHLGANSNEIRLLLNAISNVYKKIKLKKNAIVEPFLNQEESHMTIYKENPSCSPEDGNFFEELNKSLKKCHTTYKPLWLCAIVKFVVEEKLFFIPANELAMRLLAISWNGKNKTFPLADKIPFWQGIVTDEITKIQKYSKYIDILTCLKAHKENPNIQSMLVDIYNSTMSNFLKTWINSSSNPYIASKSKLLPKNCFYSIENFKDQVYININPNWRKFIEREANNIYDCAYSKFEIMLQSKDCNNEVDIQKNRDVNTGIKSVVGDLQSSSKNIDRIPFEEYVKLFSNLKADTLDGYKEPHKAVLLYAILVLIGKGFYKSNKITLNNRLERVFEKIWFTEIGIHPVFKCKIEQAFFTLDGESFWKLNKERGWVRKNSYSVYDLKKYYKGAEFSPDLFEYLQDADKRECLLKILKKLMNKQKVM